MLYKDLTWNEKKKYRKYAVNLKSLCNLFVRLSKLRQVVAVSQVLDWNL